MYAYLYDIYILHIYTCKCSHFYLYITYMYAWEHNICIRQPYGRPAYKNLPVRGASTSYWYDDVRGLRQETSNIEKSKILLAQVSPVRHVRKRKYDLYNNTCVNSHNKLLGKLAFRQVGTLISMYTLHMCMHKYMIFIYYTYVCISTSYLYTTYMYA